MLRIGTVHKVGIAKILYKSLSLMGLESQRQIKRNKIRYQVDLKEGIDLSLFLFSKFQSHVTDNVQIDRDGAVVLNIGANIGATALPYAQKVGKMGKVICIEPTDWAFEKLQKNLSLNPQLSSRIKAIKAFVASKPQEEKDFEVFASWSLEKEEGNQHPVHLGIAKSARATPTISLDQLMEAEGLDRCDLVKIDVDGNEYEVFLGMKELLRKFKPQVIFEVGKYCLEEKNLPLDIYWNFFGEMGYSIMELKSDKPLSKDEYLSLLPEATTVDLLACSNQGNSCIVV